MVKEYQRANLFELSGANIDVTYSSSSFTGEPLLSYRNGIVSRQFSGEEIHHLETEIGELLTVILEQIPDLRVTTFTLILPVVTTLPGSAGTHIQVPGITTTTHTSIVGQVFGPQKTYSQVTLKGTAQFVSF